MNPIFKNALPRVNWFYCPDTEARGIIPAPALGEKDCNTVNIPLSPQGGAYLAIDGAFQQSSVYLPG